MKMHVRTIDGYTWVSDEISEAEANSKAWNFADKAHFTMISSGRSLYLNPRNIIYVHIVEGEDNESS